MIDFLQKLAVGLIVALFVGLTTLAFTNNDAYRQVVLLVVLLLTATLVGFWLWSLGALSQTDFHKPDATNPMTAAVHFLTLWIVAMAYFAALYMLPPLLLLKH